MHRALGRMTGEQLALEGYFAYLPLAMTLILGAAPLLGMLWRPVIAVAIPERARGATAFRWFSAGSVVVLLLYFVTPYSSTWFSFVQWFRSLPVT